MGRVERSLLIVALSLCALYGFDYLSLRYQIPSRSQLGAIPVKDYYAVRLKNGKTEIMPGDPDTKTCVRSVFPQLGLAPCRYAARHSKQVIKMN